MAGGACLLTQNLKPCRPSAHRGPEVGVDRVFEIGTGLRPALRLPAAGLLVEDAGEDVAEAAPTATGRSRSGLALRSGTTFEVGEVEAFKIERHFLRSGSAAARTRPSITAPSGRFGLRGVDLVGVKAELIVDFALLFVAQDVVGFGDLLELLFRLLVAGVHIGVVFSRKFAEGFADVVRSGRLLDSE